MTELFSVRETLNDDFEEGYNAGFDDGFDMAMLTEGDEKFVVDTCILVYDMMSNSIIRVSKERIKELVSERYKSFMESRKSGISALFGEVLEDYDAKKIEEEV